MSFTGFFDDEPMPLCFVIDCDMDAKGRKGREGGNEGLRFGRPLDGPAIELCDEVAASGEEM